MVNFRRRKALLYLKAIISRTSPSPNLYPFLQHHHHPSSSSPFSLKYYSQSTSDKHPFAVPHLINNFGISSKAALKASKQLPSKASQKLDSFFTFFRNWGFSDAQIHNDIIRRQPVLLSCRLDKTVRPKFEFLQSKGASNSDIVLIVTTSSLFLQSSLENCIVPTYELLNRFFHSSEKTIACIIKCPILLYKRCVVFNIKMLLENGVKESNITNLLGRSPIVLCSSNLRETMEEVKELGFSPSKSRFILALRAKKAISKSKWDEKIDAYKSWGWSEETILEAFRRQPSFMLASKDRINAFMNFWVNELNWNSLALANSATLLGYSLQKRIIPRASVLQFLLSKGLRCKDASLVTPFSVSEKLFLQKYVNCFKEEASQLLKLYEEKMNSVPQDNWETDEGVESTEIGEIAPRASMNQLSSFEMFGSTFSGLHL